MKKFVFAVLVAVLIGCMPVCADDIIEGIIIIGDVTGDSVVNIRDAACIAYHLAENNVSELDFEAADYNADEIINVRDCADITHDIIQQYTDKYELLMQNAPQMPDKSECDVQTYVNEMVKYRAYQQYGISNVDISDYIPDDELYTLSWDVPVEFITNESDYLMMDMPILPAMIQSDCDGVIDALMFRIESMIDEQTMDYVQDGCADDEISEFSGKENAFTIYWKPYNSTGNYEVFLII